MNRPQRAALAQETLDILTAGEYTAPSGRVVSIAGSVAESVERSRLYPPADFATHLPQAVADRGRPRLEVTGETTLQALQRLAGDDPVCLNFASAKNPGGGFLAGSQAQEESLARSSGLYPCLVRMAEMYEHNRRLTTCLYSDYMVYSPRVPVFRADDGTLLETPYTASMISAPAVNAGAVRQNEPEQASQIRPTLERRLQKLLRVAAAHGHGTLVLGAWGCGVFANDPAMIAELFHQALGSGGPFAGAFERVVYAVFDRSPGQEVFSTFQRILGPQSR
jgi:uncharacterized protein (TIGR02452 family)